jgi:RNA polymerase sigma-70 factor (ECF subfamily)
MTASATYLEGIDQFRAALESDVAFEAWYRRTSPRVYAYLLTRCGNDPTLADDLLQQTLIAAIDHRARYDGRSDVVAWLCGIARHKLADHFRRLERDDRRRMQLEIHEIVAEVSVDARPDLDERTAIGEALRSLPAAQQAVLVFAVLDDRPIAEVARLMRRSTSATQSLLHRARIAFRRAYRGEDLDD